MRTSSIAIALVSVSVSALAAGCKRNGGADTGATAESAAAATTATVTTGEAPVSSADDTPGVAVEIAAACQSLPPNPLRRPAADRIVALGDVHGDLAATRAALRLAGAIDDADQWIGGDLVVVQTGDILDRGDGEQAIVDLFVRLRAQAEAAGGAVYTLNGNHKVMNADIDLRYVTPGGFADFRDAPGVEVDPAKELAVIDGKTATIGDVPEPARARVAAFAPGGAYAQILADNNVVIIVGDTAFAHGGIEPRFASAVDALNLAVRCWMRGLGPKPNTISDPDSPIWSRAFSTPPEACDDLARALSTLGVARMVVGHTPQMFGITSACDDTVWRIDTGMSSFYGGPTQVLEIRGGRVRALK